MLNCPSVWLIIILIVWHAAFKKNVPGYIASNRLVKVYRIMTSRPRPTWYLFLYSCLCSIGLHCLPSNSNWHKNTYGHYFDPTDTSLIWTVGLHIGYMQLTAMLLCKLDYYDKHQACCAWPVVLIAETMFRLYCETVGISFEDRMLNWEDCPAELDVFKDWMPWFEGVLTTKTFQPSATKPKSPMVMPELPRHVQNAIEENLTYYNKMYDCRLKPNTLQVQ